MSNNEQNGFVLGGKRPHVVAYTQKPIFQVGDSVYLLKADGTRDGPYLVATVPTSGKCALSYNDGGPFRQNQEVSVDELEAT